MVLVRTHFKLEDNRVEGIHVHVRWHNPAQVHASLPANRNRSNKQSWSLNLPPILLDGMYSTSYGSSYFVYKTTTYKYALNLTEYSRCCEILGVFGRVAWIEINAVHAASPDPFVATTGRISYTDFKYKHWITSICNNKIQRA